MTRENKLALIIAFSLVLIVAILITDHLSPAQNAETANLGVSDHSSLTSSRSIFDRLPSGGEEIRLVRSSEDVVNVSPTLPRITGRDQGTWVDGIRQGNAAIKVTNASDDVRIPPADPPVMQDQFHKIAGDETLYSIAQQYYGDGSLFEELGIYNRDFVGSDYTLTIGTFLRIPDRDVLLGRSGTSYSTSARLTPRQPERRAETRYIQHEIQDTDRLWDLAKQYLGSGAKWQVIADLNKDIIPNPDLLPLGKTIRIPIVN